MIVARPIINVAKILMEVEIYMFIIILLLVVSIGLYSILGTNENVYEEFCNLECTSRRQAKHKFCC